MDKTGAGSGYVFPMPTALLFPPSPPSPLAPYYYYNSSPSSSSPASLTSASRHHVSLEITSLPILVLTVLGILTISAILLTYYVFVIRCCISWHTTSSPDYGSPLIISLSRRRGRSTTSGHELPVVHGPAPDKARGGLGELAIRALPAFMYSKAVKTDADAGGDTSDCAVCLGEFQEEERVRLLPSCLHVFHADCVDTWLQGNANCPLCRAAITATTITSTSRELPVMGQLPRPDEEVAIQVLALTLAGPGGEDTQSHQQEADMAASKNSTHFLGDSSNSSSSDAHCR
uniref:Uncharacterized protein n=1 Tax=Avena sativa TaxID=4498 RepID=A0ACD5ZCV6_AVESA